LVDDATDFGDDNAQSSAIPANIKDPRFMPYNSLVHYQVGSAVMDIDRIYGTVSQKIQYPQYVDLVKYDIISLPDYAKIQASLERKV